MTMMDNKTQNDALMLLTVIAERKEGKRLEDILREKDVHFHYMFNAMGTASSEILKAFGLSGTGKTVCVCMESLKKVKPLMTAVVERLEFTRPGNGIAFIMPISGASAVITKIFGEENENPKERYTEEMTKGAETASEESKYEVILAVINQGYSDVLMDSARVAGARGGTIIHARHTAVEDEIKFFGISLQAEKEIVAILINRGQKKELMKAICASCGVNTKAQGIVISLPVTSCAGIELKDIKNTEEA